MRGDALPAGGVDVGKVERGVVGVQFDEQVEDGVEHFGRPGVGAVDLVDDHDGPQPALEGLAQHEARLRQRALGGVDQQQGAVGHVQDALDLAAEVGVAGRVDDVDLGTPATVRAMFLARMVMPRSRSRSLESRIRPCCPPARRSSSSGRNMPDCRIMLIDQRGFAMIDVGDDGHVSQIIPLHYFTSRKENVAQMETKLHNPNEHRSWPLAYGKVL